MTGNVLNKKLELFNENLADNRANRMCITVSDLHFTDGTVGYQNLGQKTWDALYGDILARCKRNEIEEVTFILDGDVVDLIRTAKWAENNLYPWQREKDKDKYTQILKSLLEDIVENKHKVFFDWLKSLEERLKTDAGLTGVKIFVLLGNHDKELLSDNDVLSYFYEKALGRKLDSIDKEERKWLGRMYGDENRFLDKAIAPNLPFYFGDRGFRFFTTHGQWRDSSNNRSVSASKGLPGWKNSDGWKPEIWQKIDFAPFTLPCIGDVIAAGLLSTFIHDAKCKLKDYHNQRLLTILDEMDLYRPTARAPVRLLQETRSMRKHKEDVEIVNLIEDSLYECTLKFIDWVPVIYSSWPVRLLLKLFKGVLKFARLFKLHIEIKLLKLTFGLMDSMQDKVEFAEAKQFPAFMPEYRHYGFQIHGEGHTHAPLESEFNFKLEHPATYVNYGTWRDQIVTREKSGYRRRSVLRAFYILDLNDKEAGNEGKRSLDYYTQDYVIWSDKLDDLGRKVKGQPNM